MRVISSSNPREDDVIYGAFISEMISILLPRRNSRQRFRTARHISFAGHLWFLAAAIALNLATLAWGDDRRVRAVTFVHATDPHLFVPAAQEPETKAAGDRQESLNKKALSDLLQRLPGLSGPAGAPTFLVLTGDLGVDPCDIPTAAPTQPAPAGQTKEQAKQSSASKTCVPDNDKRKDQIQRVAQAFGSSPLKEIYLVAGNNDVANEDADDDSLGYFNKLIAEVQAKIDEDKTGVQLYNLTACYATSGASSACYADIPNTSYRLIGFPSYSFKNVGGKSTNNDTQAKQFTTFRALLDQARQAGKQVLILSHVPEIDDPYTLAQDRYTAKSPDPANDKDSKNPRSTWSTWNVTTKLLNDWKDAVASDAVVAVLAGHLHDSHKEIYHPPYVWSTDGDSRLGFRKLFLAPPLAVKKQDSSPIQARGFSLMTLAPDHIEALLYWYNQETGEFKSDARWEHIPNAQGRRGWRWMRAVAWILRAITWIWQLDQTDSLLIRLAILLIALLTAYLTVVGIWQIPPGENPLAPKTSDKAAGEQSAATTPAYTSPFANNFGKTIIAGLSGLAVAEVAKSLGSDQPSSGSRWFYIVWFVSFFFVMLFGLGFFRACIEGLRAAVAIPRYALARPSRIPRADDGEWDRFKSAFSYWFLRVVHWVLSLRVPLLTGLDTFINLIQGKNQTMTKVFADTIIDQQRNAIRVADSIRKDLTKLIERKVRENKVQKLLEARQKAANTVPESQTDSHGQSLLERTMASSVRVNISVLSADQSRVFYISRSVGSARLSFNKRSVAWISVFTGEIRWYRSCYRDPEEFFNKIVLFDNSLGTIGGAEKTMLLSSHYQDRQGDYQAFAIFPVPWPPRGVDTNYVKGAIHVSFGDDADFSSIWKPNFPKECPPATNASNAEPTFEHPQLMLGDWCLDAEVRVALGNSMAVLGELLSGFNEVIYKSYIEKNQPD
jgi:hypothetical protein